MFKNTKIVSKYAQAIYLYLKTAHQKQSIIDALKEIFYVVSSNKDIYASLYSVTIPLSKKKEILELLNENMGLSADVFKILYVLVKMKRLHLLPMILVKLQHLIYEEEGIIPITVETAYELNNEIKNELIKQVSKVVGKRVEPNYVLRPALIGGIRVSIGGKTFDGSILGFFSRLEEKLLGGVNAY